MYILIAYKKLHLNINRQGIFSADNILKLLTKKGNGYKLTW